MYLALWWKDARQFWPIWVFLALAEAAVQGLLLYYLGQDARHGALGVSALICASLYAFATGAAAFAAERETGTLRLLDILPADRRVVWAAKVSFALVTTLALTLVLLAMAAIATDRWRSEGSLSVGEAIGFGLIVFLALGWGLFWSAILSNALGAAVVAIFCTSLSMIIFLGRLDYAYLNGQTAISLVIWQLAVLLATLIASVAIFAWSVRLRGIPLEFRSPVVVNKGLTGSGSRPLQVQSPVAAVLAAQPRVRISDAPATDQPARHSWSIEIRAMAWQTMKEGSQTWVLLAAMGLLPPALAGLRGAKLDPAGISLISMGIGLVAGTSVFGLENRARTQRFLTHHGARPGLVWMVKLATWSVGVALIWVPLVIMTSLASVRPLVVKSTEWPFIFLIMFLIMTSYLAVGLVCGMVIRRGITAVVIALVASLVLTIPLASLVGANMLPIEGLLAIPAGLLAVSWAWSGDWLFERPAPGRWVRLGLLLAGMSTLDATAFVGYRAWSVRDVGPIAPPAVWLEMATTPLPTDQNAAELYREAGRRLVGSVADSPGPIERNREVLDLLRRAAARRSCRFFDPRKLTVLDQPDLPPFTQLVIRMTLDATERQNHGDLAGAWDDIMVLFRMAHHVGEGSGFVSAFPDVQLIEREALGQALEWAVARGQTPERLHRALAAYRDLPNMPTTADTVRAEANLLENTLDLPTARLRDWVFEQVNPRRGIEAALSGAVFDVVTMPWERVRARRVNRLIASALLKDITREPWQRSRVPNEEIVHAQTTTRNAMTLIRNLSSYVAGSDQNEVGRRALVQVLAIRAWQLQHGGQFPKSLDALVPTELPSLPTDPYSGQPFGYKPSQGKDVPALRTAINPPLGNGNAPTPGAWLLYSFGPDFGNDGGVAFERKFFQTQPRDIVFEIPPVVGGDSKDKGKDAVKNHPEPAPPLTPAKPGH